MLYIYIYIYYIKWMNNIGIYSSQNFVDSLTVCQYTVYLYGDWGPMVIRGSYSMGEYLLMRRQYTSI